MIEQRVREHYFAQEDGQQDVSAPEVDEIPENEEN